MSKTIATKVKVKIDVSVTDDVYRGWNSPDDPTVDKELTLEIPIDLAEKLHDGIDSIARGIAHVALSEFIKNISKPEVVEDENSSNG